MKTQAKILRYAKQRFLHPELPKRQCARQSGFSESEINHINDIESTKLFKDIRKTTIEAAIQEQVTPNVVMATLKRSMDRSLVDDQHDSTANGAAKIASDILGMAAPVQVNSDVNVKHSILMGILSNVAGD